MGRILAPPADREQRRYGGGLVFLAAYGTLMTGETNSLLPAVRRRMRSEGPCLIPGRLFRVRNDGGFDYPALVAASGPCRPDRLMLDQTVPGELFTLPAADLRAIDVYEEFRPAARASSRYIRRRLIVQARSGPVRAWVYVWNRGVGGLQPVRGNAWFTRS